MIFLQTETDSMELSEDEFNRLAESLGYEKKQTESKKTVPEIGDTYYILTDSGTIMSLIWFDVDVDKQTFAMGNVFLSREEAEKAKEKRLATVRVINKIAELNNGEVLDWDDSRQHKYSFHIYEGEVCFSYALARRSKDEDRYLVRKEDAEFMIKTMKDDIKLMLGD